MMFSERHFAEEEFEKWRKHHKSGFELSNCASNVFLWLVETPKGKEVLKKLCEEKKE